MTFKIPIDVSSGGTHPAAETSDATVAGIPSGAVAGDVDTRADGGGSHSAVPGLCANGETIRSRLPSETKVPALDSEIPNGDVSGTVWTSSLIRWRCLVQKVCLLQMWRLLFGRSGEIQRCIKTRALPRD